jgi:hypothetical protein
MKCAFDNPLSDEQLLAVVDDDATDEILHHLEQCAYCTERLRELQAFEQRLIARSHPDSTALLDYGFGLLSQGEMAAIGEHLQACRECQEIVEDFEADMQDAVRQELNSPHPLPKQPRRKLNPGEMLGELIAQFLPRTNPAIALLGNADSSLIATADDIKVVLNVEPTGDQFFLDGQVITDKQEDWEGSVVLLTSDDTGASAPPPALLDDLGQFSFDSLARGVYKLRIQSLSDTAITLYDLTLKS